MRIEEMAQPGTLEQVRRESARQEEAPQGFDQTLKDAVQDVDNKQKQADQSIFETMTGEGTSLHQTMVAMEKANVSLRLMVQVRNQALDAYKEIMRMQV